MELNKVITEDDPTILAKKIRHAERLVQRAERDMMICNLYLAGTTLQEIGDLVNLKRQRIKQIVKQAGIWRPRIVQLTRDEFLGVNLTEDDKNALRAEAEKKGVSMSEWTANLIKEKLAGVRMRERLASMRE